MIVALKYVDANASPLAPAPTEGRRFRDIASHTMARILLQQESVLVNATNDAGESALHWCHSADSVRLLVEHGADLEQCDKSGHTPLMKACSRVADKNPCRADVIFALLAAGASIHTGLKANAVSVCWDNIGNDIVEALMNTRGYDLYPTSSTCSPLPWVNLSRDCGNPIITDLLKELPRIGELCGNVILARGIDGSKGILMRHARRFKAMQADSDNAEEYRQERLLEYVSPMIVQAQIALTRCKLWLVVAQSLPNPYDDLSVIRDDGRKVHVGNVKRIRRDASARAEDCLDMSLDALEALLGPLKREAEALNMLATEKEGRGKSCTYARAIAELIDSIQNEAVDITNIAVRCAMCLPVVAEGDEEAAASAAEETVLAATVAALGYGCDWTSIIAGLRDVFRAAADEDVGTADITRLVKRLLKKCCTDFTTHPAFQQLKLNKKRVQLQKARNNVRDARAQMNEFLHSSEEKSIGQRLSGEQRRKQKIEHTNLVAGWQSSVEEVEKKEAKLGMKYLAAVRELPALWEHCETQVDEMLSRKAVHLFNKADRGKIDPENPAGCAGLGKAVCAFSALIASSAHRHATAVGQIYVDCCETQHTADVVDESGLLAEAEAAASQLLDDLPVYDGEEKVEGVGKKKKKKKKKRSKKKSASTSAVGGSGLEPSDPLAKEASEKSRLARQMKREQDAAEQRVLEEEWAAGEVIRVAKEQVATEERAREEKLAVEQTTREAEEQLVVAQRALEDKWAAEQAVRNMEAAELAEATAMAETVALAVAVPEAGSGAEVAAAAEAAAGAIAQQYHSQSCADPSEHKGDDGNDNHHSIQATASATLSAASEHDAATRAAAIAARDVRLRKHRVRVDGRVEFDPIQVLHSSATTRVYGGRFNGNRPAVIKRIQVVNGSAAETSVEQEVLLELSHPNVIRMYGLPEVDAEGNQQYMAFEPCVTGDLLADSADGTSSGTLHPRTLEHVIVHEKLRGIDGVRPIMLQMVEGAAYLHGHTELAVHGLTHRDLKPANVLVKRIQGKYGVSNEAKLTDFGSSKIHDEGTMAMTQGVGTEGWQSPEAIRVEPTNAAADVFSMGLLFVYCLTGGQHVFGKERAKRVRNMVKFAFSFDVDEDAEERAESVRAADEKVRRSVATLVEEERTTAGGSLVEGNGGDGRLLELAVDLVIRMLRLQPADRPTMKEVVRDPFFREAISGSIASGISGASGGAGGGETKGESECVVCLDNERTHMFKPCNHLCVCEGCSMAVMGSTAECPACRAEVEGVARVYTT